MQREARKLEILTKELGWEHKELDYDDDEDAPVIVDLQCA